MCPIIFGLSQHRNKQHRQTVTAHLPIYWGTTRLPFTQPPELEPSIYAKKKFNKIGFTKIFRFMFMCVWHTVEPQFSPSIWNELKMKHSAVVKGVTVSILGCWMIPASTISFGRQSKGRENKILKRQHRYDKRCLQQKLCPLSYFRTIESKNFTLLFIRLICSS